jgi:hypothetical protein
MCYNTVGRHQHIGEMKFFNININTARYCTNLFLCPVVTDGIVLDVTSFTDRTMSLTSQTAVS